MTTLGYVRSWLLVAGMIGSMTAAQIFFKMAGLESLEGDGLMKSWILNSWLWVSLVVSAVGMLFWFFALRRLSLSIAYPWTAIIYVLTPLCSVLVFNDLLTTQYGVGMIFIVLGIFITTTSESKRG
jgi:drug/metabolite transporter (DMT)-like permease